MPPHPPTTPPPPALQHLLQAMPKVEIHCHLLGTVRHATFRELARRAAQAAGAAGAPVPLTDAEVDAFYERGEKPVGVLRALRALDAALLRTPDDLHRITYEYLQDAAATRCGMPSSSGTRPAPRTSRASPIRWRWTRCAPPSAMPRPTTASPGA
jgi:hypothetical protein